MSTPVLQVARTYFAGTPGSDTDEIVLLFDVALDPDFGRSQDFVVEVNGSSRSFEGVEFEIGTFDSRAFTSYSLGARRAILSRVGISDSNFSNWNRLALLHIAGDTFNDGDDTVTLSYNAQTDRFRIRDEDGDKVSTFGPFTLPYSGSVPSPSPPPTPSVTTGFDPYKRYKFPMNLTNFDRDVTWFGRVTSQGFATTEVDINATTINAVGSGVVRSDGLAIGHIIASSLGVANNKMKGTCVLLEGPKGRANLYRVKAHMSSRSQGVYFALFTGNSPGGNYNNAGGVAQANCVLLSEFQKNLIVDDVFGTDVFTGAIAGRPISFGIVAINQSGSNITGDVGVGHISVQHMSHVPAYDSYNR